MKNYEKIVPAVAMSLAVAGLGGVNAFATEAAEPAAPAKPAPLADNPPSEVAPTSSENMKTEIDSVTPKPETPETPETPEGSEGGNLINGGDFTVNVDFDFDGDGNVDVTTGGNLNVEVTPSPNPDGTTSDNVTITTPDGIEGKKPGDPFTDDEKKVEDAIGDAAGGEGDKEWTEDNTVTVPEIDENFGTTLEDKLKEQFGDHFVEDSFGGDAESGYSFTTKYEDVSKLLTDDEKNTVRDAIMDANGITMDGDKYYKDGVEVVFEWGEDHSSVTNTTQWTVSIKKVEDNPVNGTVGDITGSGSTVVDPPNDDGTDTINVPDFLNKISKGEDGAVKFDDKDVDKNSVQYDGDRVSGFAVTNEDGSTDTYNIRYTEQFGTVEGLGDLADVPTTNADFFDLLPENLEFELRDDGNIYTKDGYKVEVSFDGTPTYRYWEVSVSKTSVAKPGDPIVTPPTVEQITDAENQAATEAENAAKEDAIANANSQVSGKVDELTNQAIQQAVENAVTGNDPTKLTDELKKAIAEAVASKKAGDTENTFIVTVNKKNYTVTVNADVGNATTESNGSGNSTTNDDQSVNITGSGNASASVGVNVDAVIQEEKTVNVKLTGDDAGGS